MTTAGQQKIILCNDLIILHTNRSLRNGTSNVTIFPLDVGMKCSSDPSEPLLVTIVSEYGWELKELQFVEEKSISYKSLGKLKFFLKPK